ncbi:MAG TPA: 2OG-Fe(II) oxygenase [Burkholderiales bacterium]|jgi:Rps23 Pro-64 3,4-dihydroxylase Tpa1-like proline 4-hydroxylase
MTRTEIAALIVPRLQAGRASAAAHYADRHYFVVDDLLPEDLARSIYRDFPDSTKMMLRKTIRERKFVTAQMNAIAPLLEEVVYAFQDLRVVAEIAEITRLREVEPDEKLYAGGISLMGPGHYLHPHLDNSHDMQRERYRILNLLYYSTPDWNLENGGNLELWPDGTKAAPHTIHSRFNRLVVIATDRKSWHSVSEVLADRNRTCVSNYYFSKLSPEEEDFFHVTSFHGRPGQPVRDLLLRGDAALRAFIRKIAPGGLRTTKHYYKKGK